VINGMDVSNHQERIDWTRAAASGITFAFLKATEGVGYVDPKFTAFAAGAQAAGIPYGAYHFARPDTNSGKTAKTAIGDARAEADAFLAVAFPRQGQLLPVLDLEIGGLPPKILVQWAQAWLDRVAGRAGVTPILYTYPAFWSQMGNSTKFGSYKLWIASYGVPSPQLPAGWKSYTIWQYTSSGTVPGVAGRVDRDRLADGVTLAQITVKPPPPPPVQNLPGPVPKPDWFWVWVRWRLGVAEFEGLRQNGDVRPDEAPEHIPQWAWQSLTKLSTKPKPSTPAA
jgi:GH25 family lysozyme M1 (1,4-beta-N-acetylmuramidase)